jgi:hypothetical protein
VSYVLESPDERNVMKCSWTFKVPNKYSRSTSCGKVAKWRVLGHPYCRVHAADTLFDNVITNDPMMQEFDMRELS